MFYNAYSIFVVILLLAATPSFAATIDETADFPEIWENGFTIYNLEVGQNSVSGEISGECSVNYNSLGFIGYQCYRQNSQDTSDGLIISVPSGTYLSSIVASGTGDSSWLDYFFANFLVNSEILGRVEFQNSNEFLEIPKAQSDTYILAIQAGYIRKSEFPDLPSRPFLPSFSLDYTLGIEVSAVSANVPVPAPLALLVGALGALGLARRLTA